MTPLAVSVEEAAAMLNVSVTTLRSYLDRGWLASVRLPSARVEGEPSRRVLIAVSDLELFILKHRVQETSR